MSDTKTKENNLARQLEYVATFCCGGTLDDNRTPASDVIREAIRCISEETNRWISVSEQMPPEDTDVLAYMHPTNRHGPPEDPYIETMRYGRFYRGIESKLQWLNAATGDTAEEYGYADYRVTHWMPLPEAPK